MEFQRNTFATRLRECRDKKGWTQKEAAEKAGIQPATYSSYENAKTGSTKIPQLDVAYRLAEVFDVKLDYLCGGFFSSRTQPYDTYGDFVRALLGNKDSLGRKVSFSTSVRGNEYTDPLYYFTAEYQDKDLFDFFNEYEQFQTILKNSDSQVTADLFKQWLKGRLKELDGIMCIPF